ncbi:MAG: DNA repair and recombination protein RadA [Thermoprotei archaeon]|nr:MAG: DNA repair and recombination protein RadA [Thermoprotei archaeon]
MEDLKSLKIRGVGPITINKLIEYGYSPELIAVTPAWQISRETGIPVDKVELIAERIREDMGIGDELMTAKEYYEMRKSMEKISTGCKALDNLLLGGIETGSITEFIGEYGAGKTQICHQLSVMVQLPRELGGLEAKAIYLDTEGTFRPERIVQIAKYRGLDPDRALDNILYGRVYNTDHQILMVRNLFSIVKKENVKLVIVDSLISHFRSEYPGRENLAMRQQLLNSHVHDLLKLAMLHKVAVVVTNQVVSSPDVFFGNPLKPAGGNVVAHGCTYRIWIRKSKNKRIAKVIDSPCMPEMEVVFSITENGIEDL